MAVASSVRFARKPPARFRSSNLLASLVHGGGQQELESLLDLGGLGVEQKDARLEFGRKVSGRVFHGRGCGF
jgi:hypothetical protein